jgi:hypothetical protein
LTKYFRAVSEVIQNQKETTMIPVTQMPTFGTSQSPALYFGTAEGEPGGGAAGGGKRPAKPSKKGGKKTGGGKPAKKQGANRKKTVS